MTELHPAEQQARAAAHARDAVLAEDPARRRAHGVVHTPPELARGVVDVLDELLQTRLELPLGVADPQLHLIDPACGPGAFIAATQRVWEARGRPQGAMLSGIDIDESALASAAELRAHGPAVFTLHRADVLRDPILPELTRSSQRVLALVGNPPWASARTDKTESMQALLEDFRRDEHGVRLQERKLGVLSDAYVRFYRACAEAARQSQHGAVLALVTNGSFLDGPVHRGMRAALRSWFDELYVLDLGGSALLHRAGVRTRDDNVFGVRPSVSVSWLCRRPGLHDGRDGRVLYARLWGDRESKLRALADCRLDEIGFEPLEIERPLARFVPRPRTPASYASWPSLAEWMPFHREGVQTNRDRLAVDVDRDMLVERMRRFARGERLAELESQYADQAHFSAEVARRNVAAALERDPDGTRAISARPLAYRPFDVRWFCPVAPLCHRPRTELAAAIDRAPEVLVSVRKDRGASPYAHFGAVTVAIDNCFLSTRSSCRARAFPIRTPAGEDNVSRELADSIAQQLGIAVSASQFARYALALLASDAYRQRFDVELHADYPRLPPPRSLEAWEATVAAGEQLWSLWTRPIELQPSAAGAPAPGLRFSELRIDRARGGIFAGDSLWLACEPDVLDMPLGHHQPIKSYLMTRGPECASANDAAELTGLVERLGKLRRAKCDADICFQRYGHV